MSWEDILACLFLIILPLLIVLTWVALLSSAAYFLFKLAGTL